MAKNSAQNGYAFAIEGTAGTYSAPLAADSDVILFGGGGVTINTNNETLGKLADGSFLDGPVGGGKQQVDVPEFSFQIIAGSDEAVEPKWYKFAKMGGGKVVDVGGAKTIQFDGNPTCYTASGDFLNLGCGGKGEKITARGLRGTFTMKAEGANKPLIGSMSNVTGALVARTDVTSTNPYTVTGNDTGIPQTLGMYSFSYHGQLYVVASFTFESGTSVTHEPANDPSGIAKSALTGQDMRVKFTAIKIDTGDVIISDMKACTASSITLTGNATNGASFDIAISGTQLLSSANGDVDGLSSLEVDAVISKFVMTPKTVP